MKKKPNRKAIINGKETRLQTAIAELSKISQKRGKELQEMDRIAKLLVRRDLELNETLAQLEEQRNELDRIAKLLVRRDLKLIEMREKREAELKELKQTRAELEEAKITLEVRVKARTQELEELAQSLEGQVKKRTKELQQKVRELEKMNRLMIGRELKMVELKKEIKTLKEKLGKYRSR